MQGSSSLTSCVFGIDMVVVTQNIYESWDGTFAICDPLSENLALAANIEFELETILSVQVVFS